MMLGPRHQAQSQLQGECLAIRDATEGDAPSLRFVSVPRARGHGCILLRNEHVEVKGVCSSPANHLSVSDTGPIAESGADVTSAEAACSSELASGYGTGRLLLDYSGVRPYKLLTGCDSYSKKTSSYKPR